MAAGAAQVDNGAALRVAALIWLLGLQVDIVNDVLAGKQPARAGSRPVRRRVVCRGLRIWARYAAQRRRVELLAIKGPQPAERCLAQIHRLIEYRVENRREVARR